MNLELEYAARKQKNLIFWLLAFECSGELEIIRTALIQEALELVRIFGSMVKKFGSNENQKS
ncbi:MAG: hypothetical protein AB1298_08065 [Bacteroidota bacterium]